MSDLDHRIQVLEDIEAIRQLKARYCQACDDDHNPQKLAPLFTEDGVWEATVMGRYEGREAIAQALGALGQSGTIRNSAHHAINPIITVEGERAEGEWRLIMLYTGIYPDGSLHYTRIIGWYKEQYRKVEGRWYIHNLYCFVEESAPYAMAPERVFDTAT